MSDKPEVQDDVAEINSVEDLVENIAGISKNEYELIRTQALEEAKTRRHEWVQKGDYLCCDACPYPHRAYIGHDKVMVGRDEQGNPVFDKRHF